jgi:NTP pyrophosphatase (non-canonical NTP hydrolase)
MSESKPGPLDALVSKRAREIAEHCGPFASPHEIYGVLAEELDELFEVVKQRDSMRSTTKLIRELVDIAAASLRAANQLAASLDHDITEAEVRNA